MRPSLRPPWPTQTILLRWHPRAPQSIPRRIATTSSSNPAPIDIPKLILSPGSPHHNSLSSFLDYAKRTNLGVNTTYYVGTHYEYTTAIALMRLGFSLLRIGKSSDAGIDLIGHWALAPLREPMRTIIQCKARNNAVSPCNIRELEGSFYSVPPEWRKKDVLGLLVTMKKATKGTLEALGQSHVPMGFVMVSKAGTVQQFVWNRAAAERGLEGVGVTVRHTPRVLLSGTEDVDEADVKAPKVSKKNQVKYKTAGTKKDIQLTWMGSPIFSDRHTLDKDTLGLMEVIKNEGEEAEMRLQEKALLKLRSGKQRTEHKAPTPRGGMVAGKRGRPKGPSIIKAVVGRPQAVLDGPKLGRPKRSKNKPKVKPKIGRPTGSKTKSKVVVDAG